MKKVLFLLFFMVLLIGCKSTKSPIFKDLYLGMSYDEVLSKGFCGNRATEENGYSTYKSNFSDFAGLHYNSAKLHFKNNKLAKISFYFSTEDASKQQDFSKSIANYLTDRYGKPQDVNKCVAWKDESYTYIVYYYSEMDSSYRITYINELAIFDNELNAK